MNSWKNVAWICSFIFLVQHLPKTLVVTSVLLRHTEEQIRYTYLVIFNDNLEIHVHFCSFLHKIVCCDHLD